MARSGNPRTTKTRPPGKFRKNGIVSAVKSSRHDVYKLRGSLGRHRFARGLNRIIKDIVIQNAASGPYNENMNFSFDNYNHVIDSDGLWAAVEQAAIKLFGAYPSRVAADEDYILNKEKFLAIFNETWEVVETVTKSTYDTPNEYSNYVRQRQTGCILKSREYAKINMAAYYNDCTILQNEAELNVIKWAVVFHGSDKLSRELAQNFIDRVMSECAVPKNTKGTYNLLTTDSKGGIVCKMVNAKDPELSPEDIERNYGKDFVDVDKKITSALKNTNKGIVLLHGEPGTGKTTYIKHLISTIVETDAKKTVIYIPSSLFDRLSDPVFLSFISSIKNDVILVAEDAEVILTKASGRSQAVSNILNMTDGLLGDSLGIQLVATFNTSIGNIDDAIKRNGRCIAAHEFKRTSAVSATELSHKIGYDIEYTVPVPLSDVYAGTVPDKNSAAIGFK